MQITSPMSALEPDTAAVEAPSRTLARTLSVFWKSGEAGRGRGVSIRAVLRER